MSEFEDEAPDEHQPDAAESRETYSAPLPRVELTDVEARVLGSLIEKMFLTPDIYPMTTNAIVTACNQKTNRDPVVSFTPVIVDNALLELRQRNLVRRVHAPRSRSSKHRQTLDEALSLSPGELALTSVLLLRGAQTLGELRMRTERQHGFEDLDATEACLVGLSNRAQPLVRQLARQPGHKEARWQHLLADPDLIDQAPDTPSIATPSTGTASITTSTSTPDQAEPTRRTSVDDLVQPSEPRLAARIDELESEVATLRRQLASLAASLGETLD